MVVFAVFLQLAAESEGGCGGCGAFGEGEREALQIICTSGKRMFKRLPGNVCMCFSCTRCICLFSLQS